MSNAKHLSKSEEHFTPEYVVTAGRKVLRAIDLDPATCWEANRLVKAKRIYTRKDDGLSKPWEGTVFLNPPGGRLNKATCIEDPGKWGATRSRQALWWLKLMMEWDNGNVEAAIFIGFSIEILQVAQGLKCSRPTDWPMCVPRDRIPFDRWDNDNDKRVCQDDPSHANVIILVSTDLGDINRFRTEFNRIGETFNLAGPAEVERRLREEHYEHDDDVRLQPQ